MYLVFGESRLGRALLAVDEPRDGVRGQAVLVVETPEQVVGQLLGRGARVAGINYREGKNTQDEEQ